MEFATTTGSSSQLQDWVEHNGNPTHTTFAGYDILGATYAAFEMNAAYIFDSRDRTLFPTFGALQRLTLSSTVPGSEVEYFSADYLGQQFFRIPLPLLDRIPISLTVHASYAQPFGDTTAVPPNRNYYIGGPDSVRGFRESTLGPRDSLGNAYGGDMALSGQLEAIMPLPAKFAQSARLAAFVDFGNSYYLGGTKFYDKQGFPSIPRSTSAKYARRRASPCNGSLRWACSGSATEFPCATRKRRSLIMAMSSKASSSPSAVRSERARVLKRFGSLVALSLVAVAVLTSCRNVLNENDDDSMHTRIVNLIEDSPTVQYKIEETIVSSAAYQGLSALSAARPGSHTISFGAVRPISLVSGDATDPIVLPGTFTQDYAKDQNYTIFAYGTLAGVKTMVVSEPSSQSAPADDYIELKFVDAAPNCRIDGDLHHRAGR